MTARSRRPSWPNQASERLVKMMQLGLLLLVALMPFHAFVSVWLGHLTGHEALWQSWKEVLLVALTGGGVWLLWRQPKLRKRLATPPIIAAAVFGLLAIAVSLLAHPPLTAAFYGLKIDCEFLLAFAIAQLVGSKRLTEQLSRVIIITSGIVIAFGLLQVFVLPHDWLVRFGYGPATVPPFETVSNALHSVRIISTLGGANQLGSFLLLPLALVAWQLLKHPRWWQPLYLAAGLVVLWHTYSRSAWLGLAVAVVILALLRLPRRWRLPLVVGLAALTLVGWRLATGVAGHNAKLQFYLFHQSSGGAAVDSTSLHAQASSQGLKTALSHPLGEGLGTAGPASYHSSHPLIPEDYYLQLAIEAGLVGLGVFVVIELLLGWQLWLQAVSPDRTNPRATQAAPVLAVLVGIAVVNLFLHGWADSSTALVFWVLAGTTVAEGSA